nr:protein ALP1-like [Lolium perenne]
MTGIQYVEERMKNPKKFYKCFRMRRSVFTMLHDTLVASYGLESTSQMSSKESLALFLYMLGAPGSNSQAADRFERSVSTVSKKFHHVLDCVDRMAGDYITPNDPTFTQVHDKLKQPRFWPHFKDAIGAIDGTHIPVQVAEKDKIKYTNRKGFTSQNVLAICDFDMRFTFAVPGWPGSVHDTRVWTDARPRFHNYPHPPHGKYYLVDSGYPNRTGYLAPFKEQRYHVPDFQGAPPQNMQEKFNHLHSSLRNAIERAFGVLKLKWRILLSIPHYHDPLTQTKIITACMCLHNFIRDSKLYDDHFDRMERSSYIYEDSASFSSGHASSSSDGVMGALRQSIAESLVA